jgi:hypothetical protein
LNLRASRSLQHKLEEWDDPEESLAMADIVAGAWVGFHWTSLETQRRSSRIKDDLKRGLQRGQRSSPPTSASTAPFGLVAGPAPVASACHGAFGSTSIGEEKSLDWQRFGKQAT